MSETFSVKVMVKVHLLNFGTPFNKLLVLLSLFSLSHFPVQDFIGLQTGQDNVNGPHDKQEDTATPLDERIFTS